MFFGTMTVRINIILKSKIMKIDKVTEDCFATVMQIIESDNQDFLFRTLSQKNAKDCARLYVASLHLQGRDFPESIRTRFSVTIEDDSIFYNFYKRAASSGIGYNEIKELYESTDMPEMIWTNDNRSIDKKTNMVNPDIQDCGDISELLKKMNLQTLYTVLKPGSCPISNEAKTLRKEGANVTSYKIIINGKSVIISLIKNGNSYSYDINSFHCKDFETFNNEFKNKFMI